mmetsp:Transcript_69712/g.110577  ORF Transcript_69712/g.110577 Transcript_69712/m.110577 type:complete len:106 (+) Transcript_69712:64-381(+)
MGCARAFDRRLALYFIAPFGMLASGLGYPQHQSTGVVAGTMSGASCVVLAALWSPISAVSAYRIACNFGGCGMMLCSQYFGDQIAKENAKAKMENLVGCCKEQRC